MKKPEYDKAVYEVVMHLDADWLGKLQTWLEFAEEVDDEICLISSIQQITSGPDDEDDTDGYKPECRCRGCLEDGDYGKGMCQDCFDMSCDQDDYEGNNH